MNAVLNKLNILFNGQGLVLQVFIIILITAILHYVVFRLFSRLKNKVENSQINWGRAFVKAVNKPLGCLIWMLGVSFALKVIQTKNPNLEIFNAVDPLQNIFVIVLTIWFLLRLIKAWMGSC